MDPRVDESLILTFTHRMFIGLFVLQQYMMQFGPHERYMNEMKALQT